jgi:hypothetical protein
VTSPDNQVGSAAPAVEPTGRDWEPGDVTRLVVEGALLAIGIGYLVLALQLEQWTDAGPRAGFFPVVAGSLFAVCLAIDLVRTAARVARGAGAQGIGTLPLRAAAVLGAILAYLVLVGILGHLITAALVTAALVLLFGRRPWWQIVLTAVLAAGLSDLLFAVLGLRLPTGMLQIGFGAWI